MKKLVVLMRVQFLEVFHYFLELLPIEWQKKRKLRVVKSSFIRITIEVICIIIAVLIVAMTNREFMIQNPIAVIITISVTIAYLGIVTTK